MNEIRKTEIGTEITQAQQGYTAEIISAVKSNLAPKALEEKITSYHENDIALALEELTGEERQKLYRLLKPSFLAGVMEYSENAAGYMRQMPLSKRISVFSEMEVAYRAEILGQMEKSEKAAILDLLPGEIRSEIRLLSSFDEDEIGSRMSTNYIVVRENSTVKEAMSRLIEQAAENDNISTLYVTDGEDTFCGAIDLKDLIIARGNTALDDITTVSYPYVYADSPVDRCIPLLTEYSEDSVPVLDRTNRLVGVITAQDLLEVVEEELNEDYAKLAGLTTEEDLNEPVTMSIRKRLPWLCLLLVMGLGVSAVVGLFESTVARLPIIMCFQSLILDMAGNVGTQSLAVAIRVLMDSTVSGKEKAALVWKEVRVGMANGIILGLMSFAAIGGYLLLKGNTSLFAFAVSGCLGIAMVVAMAVSSLSGTVIPIFFKKVGIDPAVASGPLITTVNDLVAVCAYYGLAYIMLIRTMGLA